VHRAPASVRDSTRRATMALSIAIGAPTSGTRISAAAETTKSGDGNDHHP